MKIGSYDQEKKQKKSGTKRHINQIMAKEKQWSLIILRGQNWKNSHMTINRNFLEERKEEKRQYTRNRCKIISDEKNLKLIEYLQNHYKASKNNKLNDWLLELD